MVRVSEIFGPTVQGEGPLIGKPTVFVRTGGCDYRCVWCDTMFAALPEHSQTWAPMSAEEILDQVKKLSGGQPILITLSGGNPAMQDLEPLIKLGKSQGFSFSLETQGSIPRDWFSQLDWLFVSPKPPSSQETPDWSQIEACVNAAGSADIAMKVPVFDEIDYEFAKSVEKRFPTLPLYLQVGNEQTSTEDTKALHEHMIGRYRWLVDLIARDQWYSPTILPQLHAIIWGNERKR
ncbi:MAG: 7-carboxy-7-deazaguanine synthase QueE [Magnetovibrio sp.]|nr:7-carboxy-7-deazaguanine synthase QueE [Magnetovibrio sp.]